MKKVLLLLTLILTTTTFSQNIKELDSTSAINVFYATNKNCYVTEYLTEPIHRFVIFFNPNEDYLYFNNKQEIIALLNTVLRSIEKQKDIIHKTPQGEYVIISTTKNMSKITINGKIYKLDKQTTQDIINQFSKV